MSKYQPTPRLSFQRGATFARQINASRQVAQHVLDETQLICSQEQVIQIGSFYPEFWVRSRVGHNRYYHVIRDDSGIWHCYSSDERVSRVKIAQAKAYMQEQEQGKVSAV